MEVMMFLSKKDKILRTASPNGHAVRLVEFEGGGFAVQGYIEEDEVNGYWDDGDDFDTLAEAQAHFDEECNRLKDVRNDLAQARYDEEHGTVNGYDPRIEAWRNEW
jgi:hypothetical protein